MRDMQAVIRVERLLGVQCSCNGMGYVASVPCSIHDDAELAVAIEEALQKASKPAPVYAIDVHTTDQIVEKLLERADCDKIMEKLQEA